MPHPGEPLRKVTLNLYEADVVYLKCIFDDYTVAIREIVTDRVAALKHNRGER